MSGRSSLATLSGQFVADPGGRLAGELRVPGDKSISHRAIMLGAARAWHDPDRRLSRGRRCPGDAKCVARPGRRDRGPDTAGRVQVARRRAATGCGRRRRRSIAATPARRCACSERPAVGVPRPGYADRRCQPFAAPDAAGDRAAGADGCADRQSRRAAATGARAPGNGSPPSTSRCRWPAPRSSRRCCSRACRPAAPRGSPSPRRPAITPSGCWRRSGSTSPATARPPRSTAEPNCVRPRSTSRPICRRRRSSSWPRRICRGLRPAAAPCRHQSDALRHSRDPARDGRRHHRSSARAPSATSPWPTCGSGVPRSRGSRSRPNGCRSRSTSSRCCSWPRLAPRARPSSGGAEELRVKESDRIAGDGRRA